MRRRQWLKKSISDFLANRSRRLQGDVRQLKSDVAQGRAENVKIESDIAALKADVTSVRNDLEAFRESVDDRFDQQVELIKSSSRALTTEIQALKKS